MSDDIFVVPLRTGTGKAAAKALRKQGMVPAVVYGLNEPPAAITISAKVVARVLASDTGMNSVVYLQREGTDIKRHVIIKDVQRHPTTRRLVHVDFMRVDPNHKVKVHVPVRLTGVPVGVKAEGGLLDFVHRAVVIECLPSMIPAHIDVDVSGLKVGDSLRLDQVSLPAALRIIGDPHEVVASVKGKAAEEVAAPAAETAAPEPEVVAKKGKKDEKK
ncbi:MAG: 50S ribosomal protein L25 [Acidobacteria bacterium]|nr:50S ribosomal protein L25 [Acidobacteriota bacterium]